MYPRLIRREQHRIRPPRLRGDSPHTGHVRQPGCRLRLRVDVRLAPGPAEKSEAADDAERAHHRPERASRHRRTLYEVRPLADPDSAGKNEDGTDNAPRDRQERIPYDWAGGCCFGGESLTTTHVMPAAVPTTTAMNTRNASTPRTLDIRT